jgi:hypothetical protein
MPDLRDIKSQYKNDKDAVVRLLEEAEKDFQFYIGGSGQWADEDIQKLNREKRPIISFNMVLSKINTVDGFQRNNRYDIRYMPVESGDVDLADIFNQLSKHIDYQNDWDQLEADAFKNTLICGLWYFTLDIDYDKDPVYGELIMGTESPWRIIPDCNAEQYDKQDGHHFWRLSWIDVGKAKALWPDKKSEIEEKTQYYQAPEESTIKTVDIHLEDLYKDPKYIPYDKKSGQIRIDEYWYKEYTEKEIFVNTQKGEIIDSEEISSDLKQQLRNLPGYIVRNIIDTKIRVKSLFGDLILSDKPSPFRKGFLAKSFPFVPLYAYRLYWKGEEVILGMTRNLRDPQQEINKRHCQILEIIGTQAHSGIMYEEDALDKEVEELLSTAGGKAGLKLKTRAGALSGGKIKPIIPPQFPQGILLLEKLGSDYIDMISGVRDWPSEKVEPGIALQVKERQAIMTIASLFDNLKRSKRILGRFKLDGMQQVYNYEKTFRVIGENRFITINRQIFNEEGNLANVENDINASAGKFDVMTMESPVSPTYRLMMFSTFFELAKQYPHPRIIAIALEFADIPSEKKAEIIDVLQSVSMPARGTGGQGVSASQ